MNEDTVAAEAITTKTEAPEVHPLIKRNLSLLGHVNVALDVVVGQANVSVDRLFSLAKGDVVTLDADMDAPVAIRLDGKIVAMGYLVAVGDQFGVKISEIL
ncbi:FliM/FliN family flagellar motor switch protein [Dyella terrae]|uniref:FliM/FliN family flagellar motor switch protein n=1 Tax=Dyella terrae TaxID=522259 RepID=UPI001EFDBD48|nr:FliM/FliN family flagellar motor switch protein [Dyella terrae]ULU23719.1 FliM/FliN family flagellar motor switch protein [Dyella terrae]